MKHDALTHFSPVLLAVMLVACSEERATATLSKGTNAQQGQVVEQVRLDGEAMESSTDQLNSATAEHTLEHAWVDWHQMVSDTAGAVGGLSLSRSSLFNRLVEQLPEEFLSEKDAEQTKLLNERARQLRTNIEALQQYLSQWQALQQAVSEFVEQRKLWMHLANRHQFGLAESDQDRIEKKLAEIQTHRHKENFSAATEIYAQLVRFYQVDETRINPMLEARNAALAKARDWLELNATLPANAIDFSPADTSFSNAQLEAQNGRFEDATNTYHQTAGLWHVIYRQGLIVKASPEMVAIPAGRFFMGGRQSLGQRDERPVREESVDAFAMSRSEITFAQYDAYLEHAGLPRNDDAGWGRGQRPVINVTWQETMAYVRWLQENTGRAFALPTEVQWEYAARAGSDLLHGMAEDLTLKARCEGCDGRGQTRTAPVASFAANRFGLFDMLGNVWEWVRDCYRANYAESEPENCTTRVARGGSWADMPTVLRVANRNPVAADERSNQIGMRLVEQLAP